MCDGVSTSGEPQVASVAASKAGVDGDARRARHVRRPTQRPCWPGWPTAAEGGGRTPATGLDPANAPSCTYTAATVVTNAEGAVEITVGNVGDSRAYWLPEPPELPQQLTVDDSVAQELMTAGAAAELGGRAARRAHHHPLAGRRRRGDSRGRIPSVQTITAVGPGFAAAVLGRAVELPARRGRHRPVLHAAPTRTSAARALTEYALQAGGHDNITVAVIPIGGAS